MTKEEQIACSEAVWAYRHQMETNILSFDGLNNNSLYGVGSGEEQAWLAQFQFQPVCTSDLPKADFLQDYVNCWKGYLNGRDANANYAYNGVTTTPYDEDSGTWNGDNTNSVNDCRVYQHFVDGPGSQTGGSFVIKNLRSADQVSEYTHGSHEYHSYPDYHALLTFPALPESVCPYDPEFCVWFPPASGLDFVVVNHYKSNVAGSSNTSDVSGKLCKKNLCGGVVHPARLGNATDTEATTFDAATVARAHNVTFELGKHGLVYDLEDEVPATLMDFYSAKLMFLAVSVVGCVVGASYVGLMSVAIGPVVLGSIVGTFLLTLVGAVLVLMKSGLCFEPGLVGSHVILGSGNSYS